MKKHTHKSEVAEVRKTIGKFGGYAYVLHQGYGNGRTRKGLWGSAGIPDIFIMLWGRAFFHEVKVGRDKLNPAQRGFKELAHSHGTDVVVGDVQDLLKYIDATWPGRIVIGHEAKARA